MIQDIGLVIWGCKGGCRTFCDNRVVNVQDNVIRQTLKDIRSFAYFQQSGLDYYAVEFTPQYKVYTHYRSSNDSGSGAFIAITVYVPHTKRIGAVREMLDEMMTDYFREYMNPMSNTPLPGKYDDINRYTEILRKYGDNVAVDRRRVHVAPSTQDDRPQIVKYDDVRTVDNYFDDPYHPEFYGCQEVMFLRSEYVDRSADFNITFKIEPKVISHVTEAEPMSRLQLPALDGAKLTELKVNGEDFTQNPAECVADASDMLTAKFVKERYLPLEISGPVSLWATKQGRDYVMKPLQFKARKYNLQVAVTSDSQVQNLDLFAGRLYVATGSRQAGLTPGAMGGYVVTFEGPEIDRECELLFKPTADRDKFFSIGAFKPVEYIEAQQAMPVAADQFKAEAEVKGMSADGLKAVVKYHDSEIYVPYVSGQTIVVPQGSEVTLDIAGAKVSREGEKWVFTPENEAVKVNIAREVREALGGYAFKVKLGDKEYNVNDKNQATLPYGWQFMGLTPELLLRKGDVERTAPLTVTKDGMLTFNVVIVKYDGAGEVIVKMGETIKPISKAGTYFIFPAAITVLEVANMPEGFTARRTKDGDGWAIYTIGKESAGGGGVPKPQEKKPEPEKPSKKNGTVTFVNCAGYQVSSTTVNPILIPLTNGNCSVDVTSDEMYIWKNGKALHTMVLAQFKSATPVRWQGTNFMVSHPAKTSWEVKYEPTVVSRIVDFLMSKWFLGIIIAAVLVGGGIWAWKAFGGSFSTPKVVVAVDNDGVYSIQPVDKKLKVTSTGKYLTYSLDDELYFYETDEYVVNFGNEGNLTVKMSEIVDPAEVNRVLQTDEKRDTIHVKPGFVSPAARDYGIIVETGVNEDNVAGFKAKYSESKYNAELDAMLADKKAADAADAAAAADAEAKAKAHEALVGQYNALIAKLAKMSVTKADVDKVLAFEKEHKDELSAEIAANKAKVNAYRKFFDPKESFAKDIKNFSSEQQNACKYYLKITGNDPKRNFKYAAEKVIELGM